MTARRRITRVWLMLLAVTGVSWWLGRDGGSRDFGVVIVVLAFCKIRFVLLDFMELRGAPLAMRYVGEAWVLLLAAAILAIYTL